MRHRGRFLMTVTLKMVALSFGYGKLRVADTPKSSHKQKYLRAFKIVTKISSPVHFSRDWDFCFLMKFCFYYTDLKNDHVNHFKLFLAKNVQ